MLIETDDFSLRNNLFFLMPLGYFLSQTPGLFFTDNSIENLQFILSSINLIIIMTLSVRVFKANEILILVYITFIILFIILMTMFFKDLINFIFNNGIGKKFYGSVNSILGENYIRSSGTSRISLVLIVIYSTTLMKHINSEILKTIPIFLFSTIIFLYESRAVVLLLIVFVLSNLFFYSKFFFKNIKKYLLFGLFFPLLISIQINYLHSPASVRTNKYFEPVFHLDHSKLAKKKLPSNILKFLCNVSKCKDESQRLLNKDRMLTSSGRFSDWKNIIKEFNYKSNVNNLIFGYGAQGDRYLINQTASNGMLYALASSGIIGISFYLIFSIGAFLHIIRYVFKNKNKDPICHFSIFILIIIGIRSIVESSYAVFSVDFILFYMSYALSEKYNKISN